MFGSFGKFGGDKRGAFAIQFALMVVPLLGATGLAIDGGRAFLAKYELGAALDAGALAVGSNTSTDQTVLKAIAQTFVDANFKSQKPGSVTLTLDTANKQVVLHGTVVMDTYFMPILGVPTVNVEAESTVKKGGNNVEVAMALDITESMNGSKVNSLRTAAKSLVDTVVNAQQTPYFSKVALVPWGTNVHVTDTATPGNDYANALRGPIAGPVTITGATWKAATKTVTGATWKNGGSTALSLITKTSSGSPKKIIVTTPNPATGGAYANGDYVYISGVSSPSNNSYASKVNSTKFMLSDKAGSGSSITFYLKDTSGSYVTAPSGSNNATNGTMQRCFNAGCEVQVTVTSASPTPAAGDWFYIQNVNGITQINNSGTTPWVVGATPAPTSTTFMLSGSDGPSYGTWSSSASAKAYKCFTVTCEVQVTVASHGLVNGDLTQITGVAGMTSLNQTGTTVWTAKSVAANTFIATGSTGPSYSDYTSGGASQCVQEGCLKFRFTAKSGSVVMKTASNCVTERTGTEKYSDAGPASGQWLGRDYPGASGTLVECDTINKIVPLTSNKTTLKSAIDAMDVTGSTAGEIGTAWAWYMVSPNWASVWPAAENKPLAYGTKDLVKVAVLMTDGDFNTAHCKGVTSNDYAYSTVSDSDRINCAATNGEPFTQAKAICDAMKADGKKVIVYTVGFQLDVQAAKDFMVYCATDAQHAFLAENGTELQAAFNSIATSISQLRIAK